MISEDPEIRRKQMEKRFKKMRSFRPIGPAVYGPANADVTFIGWGSVKSPVLQAIDFLENDGININFVHYTCLSPFPFAETIKRIPKVKNPVMIENNFTSQLRDLIRKETGISIDNKFLKYNGRPFYPEEICDYVRRILK
jgi:2-oxoglutarate ferredoxin oxidoreductase subunit alpha